MEMMSAYVIEIDVLEKRHVGLKLSMMDKNTLNKTPESSMLSKFAHTHHPPLRSS